ncbi:GIY-YIG nuclease family protein [Algibacillus agarilyticus]|uniref:GIY-YIG nuclease family protein n=1 Tax=Algibacillus agarilyticus TaxID=2234133 RepID=UPI000DD078FC|nr:GIY-YIG nuclease family protein [Algibacillus agarilyticus]
MVKAKNNWFLYLIEAQDSSLYCGITTDVERRFKQHVEGLGAKYFRGRKPLQVVFQVGGLTRSEASKLEPRIKKLTRKNKLRLVADQPSLDSLVKRLD